MLKGRVVFFPAVLLLSATVCSQKTSYASASIEFLTDEAFFAELQKTKKAVQPPKKPKQQEDAAYVAVKKYLKGSGIPEEYIKAVFPPADPRVQIDERVIAIFKSTQTIDWDTYHKIFINEWRINMGVEFVKENKDLLDKINKDHGMDRILPAAIVGIETSYGTYVGDFSVFNALYTIIHKIKKLKDDKITWSTWAVRELGEYIKFCHSRQSDTQAVYGSYAGAFGYAQFIPSSFNSLFIDYDGDDIRDPFGWPDALGSVSNYLIKSGYDKKSTSFAEGSKNWNAIKAYNNSTWYVRVVVELRAEIIKKLLATAGTSIVATLPPLPEYPVIWPDMGAREEPFYHEPSTEFFGAP